MTVYAIYYCIYEHDIWHVSAHILCAGTQEVLSASHLELRAAITIVEYKVIQYYRENCINFIGTEKELLVKNGAPVVIDDAHLKDAKLCNATNIILYS